MYVPRDDYVFQPAIHIEASMVKAAVNFKVSGGRGKTYKDRFRAHVFVTPEEVIHLNGNGPIVAPGRELLEEPTENLRVNLMRVVIQRAAVARARLEITTGWHLEFNIHVNDDIVHPDTVQTVLDYAGRAVGVGDFRPRYGRFQIERFEVAD